MQPSPLRRGAPLIVLGLTLSCGAAVLCRGAAAQTPLTDQTIQRIELIEAQAQGLQRAINLAREKATSLNGGLRVYRPASCMYAGASKNPCVVERGAEGFVFRFLGGPPGWQVLGLPATTETEIRISADGRTVSTVLYNGAPR